jgi:hypothetical protein
MPVKFPQENDTAFRGHRGPGPVILAQRHIAHHRIQYPAILQNYHNKIQNVS